jgi:hypothetical protein
MDPNFPTALPKESSATPTLNTSTSKAVKVADLATQYNHWQTGPQTASAGNVGISLEFNFSGITHRQNLDIIAVAAEYNLVGKSRPYLVIPVPAKSNHLRICAPADNIVGKTDLEGIGVHLILANHSMAANGTVGGSYTVTPRSVCAASASGSYTETFSSTEQGVPPYNEQLTLTNVHFIPAGAYPGWAFDPTQGTYKFISTFGNASGPLSQVVCCGPNLSGWDLSAYSYQPGFGVTATEFGPPDFLVVEGGVCPVAASGLGPTAGKYINNLRAIDLTCSGSGTVNGANDHVSTSGTIQVQDPIRCGIWKGSRCDVTAAANTPSRAG